MKIFTKLITLFCLVFCGLMPLYALNPIGEDMPEGVEAITVRDTAGITRAQSSIDGEGSVEFSLVDRNGVAANGVEVTLTNDLTGEVVAAVSANGTVVFDNIAAGTWTVASTASDVTFTNVMIGSAQALAGGGSLMGSIASSLGSVSAGTAAAGVAVAGGAAVAINESTDSRSNRNPLSPSY